LSRGEFRQSLIIFMSSNSTTVPQQLNAYVLTVSSVVDVFEHFY
jgi:hypothetical protein